MVSALFIAMFALMLLGLDIAFAMGISALGYIIISNLFTRPLTLSVMPVIMLDGTDSFALTAIPMFILAGEIMSRGDITGKLVNFANGIVGHLRGGLGHTTVIVNMIMAGMSGSAVADLAATGSLVIPAMNKEGYNPRFSAALVASASTIGPVIPPSIPMILIGSLAGISVGKLFIGGAVPGFMMGVALMGYVAYYARKNDYPTKKRATVKEVLNITKSAILPLGLPVVILGSMLTGVTTPTEAGVVGVWYALILCVVIYRNMKLKDLIEAMIDATASSAMVLFVVSVGALFGWVATAEQLGPKLSHLLFSVTDNPVLILLLINFVLIILGMVMATVPIILLMTPIIFPIAQQLGMNTIHFGVMMCLNLMIGLLTPPIGLNLFLAAAIGKVPVADVIKECLPIVIVLLFVLLLVTFYPPFVLWLPNLIMR